MVSEELAMIWECTVCTNHFEGSSPPELCSSCASPSQYFTAYHYYGLGPPATRYDPRSAVARPSHTEASIEARPCFRFHAARYFHAPPEDFYRNFLESKRTFREQQRFAGRGYNSGFYFGLTDEAAIAEKLYYSGVAAGDSVRTPSSVLKLMRGRGSHLVFLEVTLSLTGLADLTDPVVLEYFMREGPARADFDLSGVPFALARAIMPSNPGGSRHTDGIGYHASFHGWTGVKFPSVRALRDAWGIEELQATDILTATTQDRAQSSERSIEHQLRNQAIVVAFSGSLLARSISRYRWTDASGVSSEATNPYFQTGAENLEEVRVAFANDAGLSPEAAAAEGFLSDARIREKYAPNVGWIGRRESF